jgi:hypothetical protein
VLVPLDITSLGCGCGGPEFPEARGVDIGDPRSDAKDGTTTWRETKKKIDASGGSKHDSNTTRGIHPFDEVINRLLSKNPGR